MKRWNGRWSFEWDYFMYLLGKSKLPKPKPDRLFAISTAYVTLNTNLNLKSEGAGICFKPIEASRFQNTELEIQELLDHFKGYEYQV